MRKILILICIMWPLAIWPYYDFQEDGIYYKIISTSKNTVEVTEKPSHYMGHIRIPNKVYSLEDRQEYTVTSIGEKAFYNCNISSIELPNSVTDIENYAFAGCSLTSIEIPHSVVRIGIEAFSRSALTSISIPNSVTYVWRGAFRDCWYLESITIPESLTKINEETFAGCRSLISINLPNSLTTIEDKAFSDCVNLVSIVMQNFVKSIGNMVFSGCKNLQSINLPNSLESIGKSLFYDCDKLREVNISCINDDDFSDYVQRGGTKFNFHDSWFTRNIYIAGEKQTSITIPNSVTDIGDFAFRDCSDITSISIPNSVISIGDFAFYGCSNITSISIPNSVVSVGNNVFQYCDRLATVFFGKSLKSLGEDAFSEPLTVYSFAEVPPVVKRRDPISVLFSHGTLYVPNTGNAYVRYLYAPFWENFNQIIEADLTDINKPIVDCFSAEYGFYNLQGQYINAPTHGFTVIKGRKILK